MPIKVEGRGSSRASAKTAALRLLLACLRKHEPVFLSDIMDVNKAVVHKGPNAKLGVYNYAARYNLVPTFTRRPLFTRAKQGTSSACEVTIELPEQQIKVAAKGHNSTSADVAASILFRAQAEKHHASHGDGSMIIQNAAHLNAENAKQFFDFLQQLREYGREYRIKLSPDLDQSFTAQLMRGDEPLAEPVTMVGKQAAEDVAYLVAAVVLSQRDPSLLPRFLDALKAGSGKILKPARPLSLAVSDDMAFVMQETLHQARKGGLMDDRVPEVGGGDIYDARGRALPPPLLGAARDARNAQLQNQLRALRESPALQELRRAKEQLPMCQREAEVVKTIDENVYSIILGATGSGKTTQVPQMLLERAIERGAGADCNIICTQPRRIAAMSVARRVAAERNEPLRESVGYHVRFDAQIPRREGSITFCTTGILTLQLQHMPETILDHTSYIVIDEVHEREINLDYLLIILRKTIASRVRQGKRVPKVILMSATIDAELFANYFRLLSETGAVVDCPILRIPGRTFPVQELYLDDVLLKLSKSHPSLSSFWRTESQSSDYLQVERRHADDWKRGPSSKDPVINWKQKTRISVGEVAISREREDGLRPVKLIVATIAHIAQTSSSDGAILVFLPGFEEIRAVDRVLRAEQLLGLNFSSSKDFRILMLHSALPPENQAEVFAPVPHGCRKIILATNIAETSVTIPDVRYVVDSGKKREKQYDPVRRITTLPFCWISKASARQRAGRAGRVREGSYYALFTRERFESLREVTSPEIVRADLQRTCLDIKAQAFQFPIREFLSEAIEPPSAMAVNASVEALEGLGALTSDEQLTPLGRLLALLPLEPGLGKMVVLGIIFRCLDPMLIIGAATAETKFFVCPRDLRKPTVARWQRHADGADSDHVTMVNLFRQFRQIRAQGGDQAAHAFAVDNCISFRACRSIEAITQQMEASLVDAGLIPALDLVTGGRSFSWRQYHQQRRLHQDQLDAPQPRHRVDLNEHAFNVPLIKALVLAGALPNLACCTAARSGHLVCRTPGEYGAGIYSWSTTTEAIARRQRRAPDQGVLLTYTALHRPPAQDKDALSLRDVSVISPLTACLFGGGLRGMRWGGAQAVGGPLKTLVVDGWLTLRLQPGSTRDALKTVIEFRKGLDRLLAQTFLEMKPVSLARRVQQANANAGARSPWSSSWSSTPAANADAAPSSSGWSLAAPSSYLADGDSVAAYARGLVSLLGVDISASVSTVPEATSVDSRGFSLDVE
ncbi:MAG: hypothetical protein M1826_001848 [Phylliscum demangeonii]|nr:MAG: hypothetical protein M1826_001848 [Phylliscum demangeonii]